MDSQRKSKSRGGVRLCAAMVGGSAVVAMAAIGLMAAHDQDGYAVAKTPTMQIGSTTTPTTPSVGGSIAMAKPPMSGPAALPSEEDSAK